MPQPGLSLVMANKTTTELTLNDISRRILGIEDLDDVTAFGIRTPSGSVPYGAIKRALEAAFAAGQKSMVYTPAPAPQAASKGGAIEAGEVVIFPYNGVNYTVRILHINQKTAKVKIVSMDGPPTRKGVIVGAELRCGLGLLKRGI